MRAHSAIPHTMGQQLALARCRPIPVNGQRCCRHIARCQTVPNGGSPVESTSSAADVAASEDHAAAEQARAGWDPDGLFSSSVPLAQLAYGSTDIFAARAARRAQQAAAARNQAVATPAQLQAPATAGDATAASSAVAHAAAAKVDKAPSTLPASSMPPPSAPQQPLPPQQQQQQQSPQQLQFADPIRPSEAGERLPPPGERRDALAKRLQDSFMPVNLDHPGLQLLHLDPPIFLVDEFLSAESCDAFIAAASATGRLLASKIGAGNVSGGGNAQDERRTSSSLLLDGNVTAQHPSLAALVAEAQEGAWRLLDGGEGWGRAGKMPAPQQYCFESPQVACYENTQHFLSHEDGFPRFLARLNGFQRHATLLVYLNDVATGGATHFDHLNVTVQPKRGTALLFFPSYSDGRPDERTLHCAQAALDTKWITQQWIVRGWGPPPMQSSAATAVDVVKVPVGGVKQEPAGRGKQKGTGRKKGGFTTKKR